MIHREPVIELIGVDQFKFAEVRSLGLINEQIDWKQRFFVPTDEECGLSVLSSLLTRYPVLASVVLADDEPNPESESSELAPARIVDLDEWFVPTVLVEPALESEPPSAEQAKEIDTAKSRITLPAFYYVRSSQQAGEIEETQLAFDF